MPNGPKRNHLHRNPKSRQMTGLSSPTRIPRVNPAKASPESHLTATPEPQRPHPAVPPARVWKQAALVSSRLDPRYSTDRTPRPQVPSPDTLNVRSGVY
ncbi:hypothetical protein IAQ61_000854 [Plenodomus lingam]|uniref:uncharacterized protein n=1 Tax=Leptosphaeria maculans TaxID=5022 RepID=UPI0033262134|nr:hypothetical protein IAQ61_000854 [Plenodomus lingam]